MKEAAEGLKVCVIKMGTVDTTFDLVGYDPAIANTLRMIFLSEIPSMDIEEVHMYQNTSIMQYEVLAY